MSLPKGAVALLFLTACAQVRGIGQPPALTSPVSSPEHMAMLDPGPGNLDLVIADTARGRLGQLVEPGTGDRFWATTARCSAATS